MCATGKILYTGTHLFESGGISFWPHASHYLHFLLIVAQLLLTGIHGVKRSYVTAGSIVLLVLPTLWSDLQCKHKLVEQLSVLPISKSMQADERVLQRRLRSVRNSTEHGGGATAADDDDAYLARVFAGMYVQEELSMPSELLSSPETPSRLNPNPAPNLSPNPNSSEPLSRLACNDTTSANVETNSSNLEKGSDASAADVAAVRLELGTNVSSDRLHDSDSDSEGAYKTPDEDADAEAVAHRVVRQAVPLPPPADQVQVSSHASSHASIWIDI